MTQLWTEIEAVEHLGNDAATFQEFIRTGKVRVRAEGAARFWPEEVALVAASHPDASETGGLNTALLTVGQMLAAATDAAAIGTIAVRAAILLTGAMDVAVYRPDADAKLLTTLCRSSVVGHDATNGLRVRPLPESLPPPSEHHPVVFQLESPGNHGASAAPRRAALVPLRAMGQVVGAILAAGWPEPKPGAPATVHVLEALADSIAGPLAVALARETGQPSLGTNELSQALATLRDTARDVALGRDLDGVLRTIVDGLRRHVPHHISAVFRADNQARVLERVFLEVSDRTFHLDGLAEITFGEGIAGRVALSGEPMLVNNAEQDRRVPIDRIRRLDTEDVVDRLQLMAIPLKASGALVGIATVVRVGDQPFSPEEFTLAQLFTGLAIPAMREVDRTLIQQEQYLGGIRALVSAVDAKDIYSRGHSERVSRLSRALAGAMELPAATVDQIELGGLLHDIGKIGIPDAILQKVSPLDDAERAVMMGHPVLGAAILADSGSEALRDLIPFVRHHHEWFNGRGYPDGLTSDEIPVGAAIIGVADAFVSMTTEQSYRAGRAYDDALNELRLGAGTQFHPAVIRAADQLAAEDRLAAHALPLTDRCLAAASPQGLGLGLGTRGAQAAPRRDGGIEFGRLGDLRALGLMIELAGITSLIPELPEFLDRVAALLSRRLGLENVMVMLCDQHGDGVTVAAQSGHLGLSAVGEYLPFGDNPWTEVCRTGSHRSLPDLADAGFDIGGDVGSAVIVPLAAQDATIGVIYVAAARPGAFTSGDTTVLMAVAGQIANSIHVAQVHDAIKAAALTDGLTGLTNHRAFYQALEVATREQQPIGVLLFDVVGLKQVNDLSSHLDGDLLLRTVARTIRAIVRPSDVVARYGGDEFAVILHGPISETAAISVGQRVNQVLLEAVEDLGLPPATLRFGVAMLPVDGITPHELVLAADRRMYQEDGTTPVVDRYQNGHAHRANASALGSGLHGMDAVAEISVLGHVGHD